MKYLKYIFAIFVLIPFLVEAQEDNNWVFGRELGISFNEHPPKIFKTRSDVQHFSICKSDVKGNILFYSSHGVIYNSKNLRLSGPLLHDGYENRSIALALPEDSSIFYIFYSSNDSGIYYAVVDIAANNGDGIVLKDKLLYRGSFRGITASKKHGGYWIVAKKNVDSILSFSFTNQGIGDTLVSKLNMPIKQKKSMLWTSLKFSHSGEILAETISLYNNMAAINDNSCYLNLYTFNRENGRAEFLKTIKEHDSSKFDLKYGILYNDIAFSPNDSLLYFCLANKGKFQLLQYQIFATDIKATEFIIANAGAAIQLAPNGKMYLIDSFICKYLSEIQYPDKIGKACKYISSSVEITKNKNVYAGMAFPNIVDYHHYAFYSQNNICFDKTKFINQSDTTHWRKFSWYFYNTDGKVFDSSFLNSPVYEFPKSGKYIVKLKSSTRHGYSVWRTDTINYLKRPAAYFTTNINEKGCQWVGYKFISQSISDTINPIFGEKYIWNFGDGTTDTSKNPLHIFTKPGNYFVNLIYNNGFCSDTFTQLQKVEILPAPKPGFAVSDTMGCAPFKIKINFNPDTNTREISYKFGDGNSSYISSPEYTFTKPGIYWIVQKLLGTTGCVTTDSVKIRIRYGISVNENPVMLNASFISNDTIMISWAKHPLAANYKLYKKTSAGQQFKIYKAFLADTMYADNVEITPETPVTYAIAAIDSCGKESSLSRIAQPVILTAQNIENKYILLQWSAYESWQNGVKEYVLEYKQPDETYHEIRSTNFLQLDDDVYYRNEKILTQCYRVRAIENKGNEETSYSNTVCADHLPQIYIPNAFSPNSDSINDDFHIYTIGIREYELIIFNKWGEKVFEGQKGDEWDGKFKGLPVVDDSYLYTLQARTIKGNRINIKGTITITK